jgi:hypothetical protein
MVSLSWLAVTVLGSLPVMVVLEIILCLQRSGEAVEIDLHEVEGVLLGVTSED